MGRSRISRPSGTTAGLSTSNHNRVPFTWTCIRRDSLPRPRNVRCVRSRALSGGRGHMRLPSRDAADPPRPAPASASSPGRSRLRAGVGSPAGSGPRERRNVAVRSPPDHVSQQVDVRLAGQRGILQSGTVRERPFRFVPARPGRQADITITQKAYIGSPRSSIAGFGGIGFVLLSKKGLKSPQGFHKGQVKIVAHEIGHAMGLGHVANRCALMYGTLDYPRSRPCSIVDTPWDGRQFCGPRAPRYQGSRPPLELQAPRGCVAGLLHHTHRFCQGRERPLRRGHAHRGASAVPLRERGRAAHADQQRQHHARDRLVRDRPRRQPPARCCRNRGASSRTGIARSAFLPPRAGL